MNKQELYYNKFGVKHIKKNTLKTELVM